MKNTFSNKSLEIITNYPEIDTKLLELVNRVASSIDSDLERIEKMTDGSGFQGVDPAASIYRAAIQKLQLFNDLYDDIQPLKSLFDEMWSAVYEFKSKV